MKESTHPAAALLRGQLDHYYHNPLLAHVDQRGRSTEQGMTSPLHACLYLVKATGHCACLGVQAPAVPHRYGMGALRVFREFFASKVLDAPPPPPIPGPGSLIPDRHVACTCTAHDPAPGAARPRTVALRHTLPQ